MDLFSKYGVDLQKNVFDVPVINIANQSKNLSLGNVALRSLKIVYQARFSTHSKTVKNTEKTDPTRTARKHLCKIYS